MHADINNALLGIWQNRENELKIDYSTMGHLTASVTMNVYTHIFGSDDAGGRIETDEEFRKAIYGG